MPQERPRPPRPPGSTPKKLVGRRKRLVEGEPDPHPAIERVISGVLSGRKSRYSQFAQFSLGHTTLPGGGPSRWRIDTDDGGTKITKHDVGDIADSEPAEAGLQATPPVERHQVEALSLLGHVYADGGPFLRTIFRHSLHPLQSWRDLCYWCRAEKLTGAQTCPPSKVMSMAPFESIATP